MVSLLQHTQQRADFAMEEQERSPLPADAAWAQYYEESANSGVWLLSLRLLAYCTPIKSGSWWGRECRARCCIFVLSAGAASCIGWS